MSGHENECARIKQLLKGGGGRGGELREQGKDDDMGECVRDEETSVLKSSRTCRGAYADVVWNIHPGISRGLSNGEAHVANSAEGDVDGEGEHDGQSAKSVAAVDTIVRHGVGPGAAVSGPGEGPEAIADWHVTTGRQVHSTRDDVKLGSDGGRLSSDGDRLDGNHSAVTLSEGKDGDAYMPRANVEEEHLIEGPPRGIASDPRLLCELHANDDGDEEGNEEGNARQQEEEIPAIGGYGGQMMGRTCGNFRSRRTRGGGREDLVPYGVDDSRAESGSSRKGDDESDVVIMDDLVDLENEFASKISLRFRVDRMEEKYSSQLNFSLAKSDYLFFMLILLSSTVMLTRMRKASVLENGLWNWKWHHFERGGLSMCAPWVLMRLVWAMGGFILCANPFWFVWYAHRRTEFGHVWDVVCWTIESVYFYGHDDILIYAIVRQVSLPILGSFGRHNSVRNCYPQRLCGFVLTLITLVMRGGRCYMPFMICVTTLSHVLSFSMTYVLDRRVRLLFLKNERMQWLAYNS